MTRQQKFARNLGRLLKYAIQNDIDYLVTEIYRTAEQQNEIFKSGKGVTNCDGYKVISQHQKGLAADLVIQRDGNLVWDHVPEYDKLGKFWQELGGEWGGTYTSPAGDIYHFAIKD